MKRVYYNGRSHLNENCQSPSKLSVGRCYEVVNEVNIEEQTNYILKGLEDVTDFGEYPGFNSECFKIVPVYQAISDRIPVVGKQLENISFFDRSGRKVLLDVSSSKVTEVHPLSENMYEVYTSYNTYIVQVI